MDDERPRKWDRLKEWTSENSVLLNFCMVCLMFTLTGIQTYQGWVAISDRAEELRPRLSFQMKLERIGNPTKFRIVMPLEIGGTTDARRVTLKSYFRFDKPRQRDYLSYFDIPWDSLMEQPENDVAPTERERKFMAPILSPTHLERIRSKEESYYFLARLEYCDSQDNCYYFMRCAELGDTGFVDTLAYCGSRSGRLERK